MPELKQQGDVLITCKSCKSKFPMRELRYDRKGEDLICKGCFDAARSPAERDIRKIAPEKLEPTGPRMRDSSELTKYYCLACRFKFSRKADFRFETCPSCGKAGSIKKDVPMSTSQLLEESDDFFG